MISSVQFRLYLDEGSVDDAVLLIALAELASLSAAVDVELSPSFGGSSAGVGVGDTPGPLVGT